MLRTRMPWRSLGMVLLASVLAIGVSGCIVVPVGGYGGGGYAVVAPLPLPVIVAPPVVYGYRYRSYGYGHWR
jgi:hypothetical protein